MRGRLPILALLALAFLTAGCLKGIGHGQPATQNASETNGTREDEGSKDETSESEDEGGPTSEEDDRPGPEDDAGVDDVQQIDPTRAGDGPQVLPAVDDTEVSDDSADEEDEGKNPQASEVEDKHPDEDEDESSTQEDTPEEAEGDKEGDEETQEEAQGSAEEDDALIGDILDTDDVSDTLSPPTP